MTFSKKWPISVNFVTAAFMTALLFDLVRKLIGNTISGDGKDGWWLMFVCTVGLATTIMWAKNFQRSVQRCIREEIGKALRKGISDGQATADKGGADSGC